MSSLDNWDGSLSKAAEQKSARIIDLLDDSPGASTLDKTADKRINVPTIGIRHGWQGMVPSLDVHRMVCCRLTDFCIVAQVAVNLARRVKFESVPIAQHSRTGITSVSDVTYCERFSS